MVGDVTVQYGSYESINMYVCLQELLNRSVVQISD